MSFESTDFSVPNNSACPFITTPPGTEVKIGWGKRPELLRTANLATKCVHAGTQPDPAYGSVAPPLYQTSTFAFSDLRTHSGYDYTRSGNPTRSRLEDAISMLEGGSGASCTSTGMSAVLVALNLLPHGSHVLCTFDCYGGTFRALEHFKNSFGLQVDYLNLANMNDLAKAWRSNTRMVFIETPSNPLLRLTNIQAVSDFAHERKAIVAVDNTFLTPLLQRPFEFGADLVVHSTTKYLNGHSDVVGGAVVAAPVENLLAQRIAALNNTLGTSQSPHDAWLVLRGLKTLKIRMEAHEANAREIAKHLASHPAISKVNYPGLPSHPQFELAGRQQNGFGAMISFELKDVSKVDDVLKRLQWFGLAESLGGIESLVAHPASMTHASMTPEARQNAGISDGLIRLSVGIEHMDDLINDLNQALT